MRVEYATVAYLEVRDVRTDVRKCCARPSLAFSELAWRSHGHAADDADPGDGAFGIANKFN